MFRSIRWSLFLWYALILTGIVGAFGGVLYTKLHRSMYREADGRLRAQARTIAAAMEVGPDGEVELELSEEFLRDFRQDDEDAPYYGVWDADGRFVGGAARLRGLDRGYAARGRRRRSRREFAVAGPAGTLVLVGQKLEEKRDRLQEFLGAVIAGGIGVLIFGLGGGWFLAGRVLRPVGRISAAADAITGENLSRRIDVAKTENELERLAQTLNRTFERLEQSFERQTRFTADASHELRTPLSIVISHAELALRKDRTPPEYREALQSVLSAAQRMKAVVEGLLTLARADARDLNLRKERVDLHKVVDETARLLAPVAKDRNVSVTASAETAIVTGDPDRLREVVANLLTNAIRYNRDGGRVDVALEVESGRAVLTVTDTGIGIPEKEQSQVFERFYRVDKARSREQGGSGLGLAITKWIVEAHGGTISFTSREGSGTTFTVHLPRAE